MKAQQSKNVIESYLFACGSRDLSIYSERLLLKIVEVAQQSVRGVNFKDGTDIGQVSIGKLGEARLEIPIRSLLGTGSTNYQQAKRAILELQSCPYVMECQKMRNGKVLLDEDDNPQYEMISWNILNACELNVKEGYAVIEVNNRTWEAILNFSRGFRRYELNTALKLRKGASLRLFKLLSNQTDPITYSIDWLRERWGTDIKDKDGNLVRRKYPDTYDFIRRNIQCAKEELDAVSPWSFNYVVNSSEEKAKEKVARGENKKVTKKSITSVTFFPVRKASKFSTSALVNMTETARSVIDTETYNRLIREFGFDKDGLNSNLFLFSEAKKEGVDLTSFLDDIKVRALHANNVQGYVVNALKRHLKETTGVEITRGPLGF